MELKQRIITSARQLFVKQGIKGVTMDDLARDLGISKKTLYQHFDNKEHLIAILLQSQLNEETRIIRDILAKSTDAIDEILKIGTYVLNILRELPAEIVFDLQKYYAAVYGKWNDVHKSFVYEIVKANLDRGKTQGLYRSNLNTDVLARIYVESTTMIVNDEVFPPAKYLPSELFEHFLRYHLNGIVSQSGYAHLQKHFYEHFNEAA